MNSRKRVKNFGGATAAELKELAKQDWRADAILEIAELQSQGDDVSIPQVAKEYKCHHSILYRAIDNFNTYDCKGLRESGRPNKNRWKPAKSLEKPDYRQRHFDD